jgi:hypothetical protein
VGEALIQKFAVNICVNPDCQAEFKRLGEGQLTVLPVKKPELWGLPKHAKQKVVWLCKRCSSSMYVRADHQRHAIQILQKPRRSAAA